MAKKKVPSPLDLRHLLVKELDPAQARSLAEIYFDAGRRTEAVLFFVKAEATDELERMRADAIECGDAFLLKILSEKMERDATAEEWRQLEASAHAAGKERYAMVAARQADVA